MNDLGDGIYVGNVANSEWEKDEEVGGFVQVLFEDGDRAGGLWMVGSEPHAAQDPRSRPRDDRDPRRQRSHRGQGWTHARARRRRHGVDAEGRRDLLASVR